MPLVVKLRMNTSLSWLAALKSFTEALSAGNPIVDQNPSGEGDDATTAVYVD